MDKTANVIENVDKTSITARSVAKSSVASEAAHRFIATEKSFAKEDTAEKALDMKAENSSADKSIVQTANSAQSTAHTIDTAEKMIDKKSAADDLVATETESKPKKIKKNSDVHEINSSTGHQTINESSSENIKKSSKDHSERRPAT